MRKRRRRTLKNIQRDLSHQGQLLHRRRIQHFLMSQRAKTTMKISTKMASFHQLDGLRHQVGSGECHHLTGLRVCLYQMVGNHLRDGSHLLIGSLLEDITEDSLLQDGALASQHQLVGWREGPPPDGWKPGFPIPSWWKPRPLAGWIPPYNFIPPTNWKKGSAPPGWRPGMNPPPGWDLRSPPPGWRPGWPLPKGWDPMHPDRFRPPAFGLHFGGPYPKGYEWWNDPRYNIRNFLDYPYSP